MSAKLNKDEMIKLALDNVTYAEICRMAFPDKDYKNPASTILKIIGSKRDLLAGKGPLLRPTKQAGQADDEGQENALEDTENASEVTKREYNRHKWEDHYEIIGPMLSKGHTYKSIYTKIAGSSGSGASLNMHINNRLYPLVTFINRFDNVPHSFSQIT